MGDQSKRKQLFTIKAKFFAFVLQCSHVWCRSRRFDCILLVFFRRWGRLVMRDLIKHDALLWLVVFQQLWLVHFDPCCFTQWFAPSAVRCRTALLLLSFFIVGIHTSGISIPLSLLMLLGWSPIWIASLTLRVTLITTRVRQTKKTLRNSLQCYHFILVPLWIVIVQRKFFFKIYWILSCSCKTQVLSACCPTDWLEKC